jgi:hypothetical protein
MSPRGSDVRRRRVACRCERGMRTESAAARSLRSSILCAGIRETREVHDERRSRKHSWNVATPAVSFVANQGLQAGSRNQRIEL